MQQCSVFSSAGRPGAMSGTAYQDLAPDCGAPAGGRGAAGSPDSAPRGFRPWSVYRPATRLEPHQQVAVPDGEAIG